LLNPHAPDDDKLNTHDTTTNHEHDANVTETLNDHEMLLAAMKYEHDSDE